MDKDKSASDIISEKEYTMRMKSASTEPQDDSPGDSESDAGSEFEMGLEYIPNIKYNPEEPIEMSDGGHVEPTNPEDPEIPILVMKEIPENAKVISSEQPAPWMDMEADSSTH